jgi:hypothetical protein
VYFPSFFKKKEPENVPETFGERLSRVEKRLTRMEAEILDVATAQDIIRDKVLRKIQVQKPKPEPQESEEKEDLYKNVLIKEY